MIKDEKHRLKLIYGEEAVENLKVAKIMIAGLGGVGSYCAEAIARSFIDNIVLVDFDVYDITNLNRQLHADLSVIGQKKVDIVGENMLKINKTVNITTFAHKITEENIKEIVTKDIDYVIDAIDDVKAKIALIEHCYKSKIGIISCMGTGNKINPELLKISDIKKTSVCPLAKKIRHELKIRNIDNLPVVFSTEEPRKNNTKIIGSTAFVPATAGLLLASYVINKLMPS